MHQLVGVIDEREAALACLADCFCSSLSSGVVGKVESAKVRVCWRLAWKRYNIPLRMDFAKPSYLYLLGT